MNKQLECLPQTLIRAKTQCKCLSEEGMVAQTDKSEVKTDKPEVKTDKPEVVSFLLDCAPDI